MPTPSGRATLWGMEVFVATAQEAAISGAARRLGISAATVSQQLTNLEAACGAVLLDRAARPVTLTPAGEMFLRRANAILHEAEQAQSELAMADLTQLTRLRLGMVEDFDADVTPALLTQMSRDLTHCHFLLETGASHRLLELLDSRALDVVVAAGAETDIAGMEVHPLMQEPFVIAAPRGRYTAKTLSAGLLETPLIQYTTRHLMGRMVAAHLEQQGVTPKGRFELDSYHAILAMIADGAGWSILTPLGVKRAWRFQQAIDIFPLPFAPLSRSINLYARAEVLASVPATMANHLRPLIEDRIVSPAVADRRWLADALRVLP